MFVIAAATCGCICVLLVWGVDAARKGQATLSRGLPMAPGLAAGALAVLAWTYYGTWAGIVTAVVCCAAAGVATMLAPEPMGVSPSLPASPVARL